MSQVLLSKTEIEGLSAAALKQYLENVSSEDLKKSLEVVDAATLKVGLQIVDGATLKVGLENIDRATLKVGLEAVDKATLTEGLQRIDGATLKVAIESIDRPTLKIALESIDGDTLKEALQRMDRATLKVSLNVIDAATRQAGYDRVDAATRNEMDRFLDGGTPTPDAPGSPSQKIPAIVGILENALRPLALGNEGTTHATVQFNPPSTIHYDCSVRARHKSGPFVLYDATFSSQGDIDVTDSESVLNIKICFPLPAGVGQKCITLEQLFKVVAAIVLP